MQLLWFNMNGASSDASGKEEEEEEEALRSEFASYDGSLVLGHPRPSCSVYTPIVAIACKGFALSGPRCRDEFD